MGDTMSRNVAILGAGGRMGRALTRGLMKGSVEGLRLSAAVERSDHPELGQDIGILAGTGLAKIALICDLGACASDLDVAIDFSDPIATAGHAKELAHIGRPLVIGTTGFTSEERTKIERAASKIAIVLAPNMSLGVNLLFGLAKQAARSLKENGYDVEIIERHHRHKKDAPSGTALGLGEAVAEGLGLRLPDVARYGRNETTGERTSAEIGFHAIRGGDFVGDHTVLFATTGECMELSHRATSRDTFATGALTAAAWVCNRPPGLYTMQEVLGLPPEHACGQPI